MDRQYLSSILRKGYQQDLRQLYKLVVGKNRRSDYVFLSDSLGTIYDIQKSLHELKKKCRPETRLVLNYHNFLWQPMIEAAENLGLKSKQPRVNWLNRDDIYNLLKLEGFEVIKSGKRYLWPIPLGGFGRFMNKYVAAMPIFNIFCLTNYVLARLMPKPTKPSVSIIIAARNERGNIENLVRQLRQSTKEVPQVEFIFVEGHSKDGTWEEIKMVKEKYRSIKIIATKQSGEGKADAVWKGFGLARNDLLLIWDADISVNPTDFRKFYDAAATGMGEFIFGSRLVYPLEKESMRTLNILGNKFFSWVFTWLLGQPIKDTLCGTKVISRENYLRLAKNRKYFGDFDPFGDFDLIFGASKLNLKFVEIPIRYQARTYGKTNISRFTHGWLLLKMVFYALNKLKFV